MSVTSIVNEVRKIDRSSSYQRHESSSNRVDFSDDRGVLHSIFSLKRSTKFTTLKTDCPICGEHHRLTIGDTVTCKNGGRDTWLGMRGAFSEGGFFADTGSGDRGLGNCFSWHSADQVNKSKSESQFETEAEKIERNRQSEARKRQQADERRAKEKAEIEALLTPQQFHNSVLKETVALNRADRADVGRRLINAFRGDRAAIKATIDHLEASKILGHASRGFGEFKFMAINSTINGLMHPVQIAKVPTKDHDVKYIWNDKVNGVKITNRVKATNHPPHMACPQLAPNKPDYVGVVEGVLGSVIAQILFNQAGLNVVVMGVAGNADFLNPNLLKAAESYGCPLVMIPDWDTGINQHVLKQLEKTIKADVYDAILWAGQGQGVKANIDDLTIEQVQSAELKTPQEFLELIRVPDEDESNVTYLDMNDTAQMNALFTCEPGIVKVFKPGTGLGKSQAAADFILRNDGSGVPAIFITPEFRNQTIPVLQNLQEKSGRHAGLKLSDDGRRTVAAMAEVRDPNIETLAGNCFQSESIATLRSLGAIESTDETICSKCKLYSACRKGVGESYQGESYGYIFQRNQLKGSYKMAPQSLPLPSSDDWEKQKNLIFDESPSIEAIATDKVVITREAIHRIKSRLMETEKGRSLYYAVAPLFDLASNTSHYGLSVDSEEITNVILNLNREALLEIEPLVQNDFSFIHEVHGVAKEDLPKELRNSAQYSQEEIDLAMADAIPAFIPSLLNIIDNRGAIEFTDGKLILTTQSQQLEAVLLNGAVLLDATPNLEELRSMFGTENVKVFSARTTSKSATIKTIKVKGSKNTTQRTNSTQLINEAIVQTIASQPGRKVAVVDRKSRLAGYKGKGIVTVSAFAQSRGSNHVFAAGCNTLIVVGGFNINLSAMRTKHHLYAQNCARNGITPIDFKEYYQANKDREMTQAIGRLRASRRAGEELEVFILDDSYQGHYDVEVFPEQVIQDVDKLHGKSRTIMSIANAIKSMIAAGESTTLRSIGALAGCSHTTVANHWAVVWALIAQNETIVDACEGLDDDTLIEVIGAYLDSVEEDRLIEEIESEVYEFDYEE